MKRRIEELESELREKETVSGRALSHAAHIPWALAGELHPGTWQVAVGRVIGPGSCPDSSTETEPGATPRHKEPRAKA